MGFGQIKEVNLSNSPTDPFLDQLFNDRISDEIAEIQNYLLDWDAATFNSVAENVIKHAYRKNFDSLKYLRKAFNFNRNGAQRTPKTGYRQDGSVVYRKGNEYIIVRPDKYNIERIVTYGVNDE